ncbi:hypothetical protein CDG79_39415 [Nostoc sp. 'Peltigera membranacea cyanobiont' 232]|nr:hypothetical protein CDG79_39415 [Nostoc sp. 'Peltigera membranacea cyanobiont' 232]
MEQRSGAEEKEQGTLNSLLLPCTSAGFERCGEKSGYYTPHTLIFSDSVKSQIKQEDQYF